MQITLLNKVVKKYYCIHCNWKGYDEKEVKVCPKCSWVCYEESEIDESLINCYPILRKK